MKLRCLSSVPVGVTFLAAIFIFIVSIWYLFTSTSSLSSNDSVKALTNECQCIDAIGGRHNFCYQFPNNNTIIGNRFNCKYSHFLEKFKLLSSLQADMNKWTNANASRFTEDRLVFVTGVDESHWLEIKDLIKTIQVYRVSFIKQA